jgi:exopolysaccharide biosynthesis polyprenyl glycosylphosphotransferase
MKPRDRVILENKLRWAYAAMTALVDAALILASLAAGYAINFPRFSLESFLSHQWTLVLYSIVLYTGLSAVSGVYRQAYSSLLRLQLAAAVRAYGLGTLIIFATLFLFRNTYYSNGALLTYLVLIPLSFLCGRLILDRLRAHMQKLKWGLEPALIVLLDAHAADMLRSLDTYPAIGYNVLSVVNLVEPDRSDGKTLLVRAIEEHEPTCLLCCSEKVDSPELFAITTQVSGENITVRVVANEVHEALTRTRLYDFAGVALTSLQFGSGNGIYDAVKRFLDLFISTILLVALSPFVLILSLAIRLESSGGVFFRQTRSLSRGSRPVRLFKFRSMREGAEDLRGSLDNSEPQDEILFKSPDDPRVTRVGRIIRKYSLDELPQLLNVIIGDMSLVGPRPLPVLDFERLPSNAMITSLYERRAFVKPGVTGLWQVSGRSGLNSRQMLILDLYYAENRSLVFDLEILFKTLPVVLSGRGAY